MAEDTRTEALEKLRQARNVASKIHELKSEIARLDKQIEKKRGEQRELPDPGNIERTEPQRYNGLLNAYKKAFYEGRKKISRWVSVTLGILCLAILIWSCIQLIPWAVQYDQDEPPVLVMYLFIILHVLVGAFLVLWIFATYELGVPTEKKKDDEKEEKV